MSIGVFDSGIGGLTVLASLRRSLPEADLLYLSVVLVLMTVVSYWYYLRVAWYMWMREADSEEAYAGITVPLPMRFALILSVVLVLYLGVFPGSTVEFARSSVQGLSAVGQGLVGLAP